MTSDLSATTARIETLITALDTNPDAVARHQAAELVRETMALYGAGLARMVDILREQKATPIIERFVADPAVATVLALHDLQPSPALASQAPLVQITRRAARDHSPSEHCERCRTVVPTQHAHIVDLATRQLQCSCPTCWQAVREGDLQSDLRAVPERCASYPPLRMSEPHWDAMQIPVGLAFFMVNSKAGRTFAFYPSPAGAVESLLPMEAWHDLSAVNSWLSSVAPDVEAVVIRKPRDTQGECESTVVPIDACYDLIGRIRLHWSGFDGGEEVKRQIDRFFENPFARGHAAPLPASVS